MVEEGSKMTKKDELLQINNPEKREPRQENDATRLERRESYSVLYDLAYRETTTKSNESHFSQPILTLNKSIRATLNEILS